MQIEAFWELIEPGKDDAEPEESLRSRLEALSPDELIAFQQIFDELHARAYRWHVWGAAYLLEGGCSDDGFTDFRYALISKGRQVFERALEDPDSLADVDIVSNELFGYIALEVYEEKTGEDMPRSDSHEPAEPLGEPWDFDDAEANRRRLPKIAERTG